MNNNFHDSLNAYSKQNDGLQANRLLMYELGRILVKHKDDFVELLNQSGVYANKEMSDLELINKFIDSINYNRKLLIGSAFLANLHNKSVGFDGNEEINDDSVKNAYKTMYSYFNAYDYIDGDSESSNAGGIVGAIAGAAGEGAKLGSKIADNKRAKKYGALDLLTKKQDAKAQLVQSAMAQKQADALAKQKEKDSKSKVVKIALISTAAVVVIGGAIWLAIYLKRKRNNK